MICTHQTNVHSPNTNNNLLRRSEVVALINTLHRFTESLEGIKQFRRMWAEIGPSESAQLLKDSQEVVSVGNPNVQTCAESDRPLSQTGPLTSFEGDGNISTSLQFWLKRCQDALRCIGTVTNALHRGSRALSSIFEPSRKEFGPGTYGEL